MQEVAGRALVMMESATAGNQGIAADLVQEAFIALHKSYADKPSSEWYPLFLHHFKITNYKTGAAKKTVGLSPFACFRNQNLEDDDEQILDIVDEHSINPSDFLSQNVTIAEIQAAISALPVRQQQAFMLRAWEGFDTDTTAQIMQCSSGSVKNPLSPCHPSFKTTFSPFKSKSRRFIA